MTLPLALLVIFSLLLTLQSIYSATLMLYAWEDADKRGRNNAPTSFEPPTKRFTVLLPARHEEEVIRDTIQRVVDLNYPHDMVEVLVVIEGDDFGTIDMVLEKLAQLRLQGINHVRLLTFSDPPINKPHGLNVGLRQSTGDVVTIFDAEDEPHPDILQIVNTVMLRDRVPVVQCGVQLMNYADHWFSALNVLEYFFWFKSRMHYHARVGMVLLGGNTVFMQRDLLVQLGGWDEACLTEDADIGIRLSTLGVPVHVVYDDRYVTKEETPPTVGQFIKQRTRWNQGFLQIVGKGDLWKLPNLRQRLLAFYSLVFPILQAVTVLYVPISIWSLFFLKVPVLVAIIASLPLYVLVLQYVISLVGLYEFTSVHKLRPSPLSALWLLVVYLPFQWMLGFAALRAVWRHLRGVNNWEKTKHVGAHRSPAGSLAPAVDSGQRVAGSRQEELRHG